jgi:acetyltransferase-like isoleucine patch superfamily enzyme
MVPSLRERLYRRLLQLLQPLILDVVYTQPWVWGDRARLQIAPTAGMVNTLFNTSSGRITVGEHSFTGHNVSILTGSHDYRRCGYDRMAQYPTEGRDIVIGRGVWIGSNATVLGPCTIGDHAVVAAGAVVTAGTVVPEGAIVAGVPAQVVKMIDLPASEAIAPG